MVDKLGSLPTSKGARYQFAQISVGHKDEYWAGTEAGQLNSKI